MEYIHLSSSRVKIKKAAEAAFSLLQFH